MDRASCARPAATKAGGSGGTNTPPRLGLGDDWGPEPNSDDKEAFDAYWAARREALPVDFHGDRIDPHEVKFVERFLNAGHTLSWIPRDRDSRKSTHDFMWLNHGPYEIELKSTKAKYSTIRGQIMGAVKRAKGNHNVTKSRFIIDLGDQPLTAELREELTHYNLDRSLYKIKALWVMTQGELEQINLRKK
mgnify:CR=1 FL=1